MKKSALIQKGNRAEKALNISLLVINQKGSLFLSLSRSVMAKRRRRHIVSFSQRLGGSSRVSHSSFFAIGPCPILIASICPFKAHRFENVALLGREPDAQGKKERLRADHRGPDLHLLQVEGEKAGFGIRPAPHTPSCPGPADTSLKPAWYENSPPPPQPVLPFLPVPGGKTRETPSRGGSSLSISPRKKGCWFLHRSLETEKERKKKTSRRKDRLHWTSG